MLKKYKNQRLLLFVKYKIDIFTRDLMIFLSILSLLLNFCGSDNTPKTSEDKTTSSQEYLITEDQNTVPESISMPSSADDLSPQVDSAEPSELDADTYEYTKQRWRNIAILSATIVGVYVGGSLFLNYLNTEFQRKTLETQWKKYNNLNNLYSSRNTDTKNQNPSSDNYLSKERYNNKFSWEEASTRSKNSQYEQANKINEIIFMLTASGKRSNETWREFRKRTSNLSKYSPDYFNDSPFWQELNEYWKNTRESDHERDNRSSHSEEKPEEKISYYSPHSDPKNYYGILGLKIGESDPKVIRKAYIETSYANHPDKFLDPKDKKIATEKLKEINKASEVLRDITKKSYYDRYGEG